MADIQIYNKLKEMGINITSYKWMIATDKQAANRIVAGFTDSLKTGGTTITQNKIK